MEPTAPSSEELCYLRVSGGISCRSRPDPERMNCGAIQDNTFAACEEMRAELRQAPVFCPKPRRLTQLAGAALLDRHRLRSSDSPSSSDLLDLFLSKGGEGNQVGSSPPFFTGSPPTRSANPLVHDARFGEEKPVFPTGPVHLPSGSPMSPTRKGFGPTKFGFKPAPVRIEGFDCLDRRDRPTRRSITAVA
ncbi:hypothetical protein J5N97_027852 [Dioscorea zingiberensis]|uniref:Uncharacterized protein n=1 Tax=Dioscorea zingiberensis TaxID=325984 RepID=A0A9D5H452_9LILI|nr:hypothetical protein J5N97_027852 [Dioscorea zingiberensis]